MDLNFDDLLVLQVIDTVEFVSIPAAAFKFERLAVVKHPVKLVSPFIIADIQNPHKLWEGATNVSELFDVLSARQID